MDGYLFAVFNEVCVSSAYSFVSKKLRVNYGILDVYRVTACIVKVAVDICEFLLQGSRGFVLSYVNLFEQKQDKQIETSIDGNVKSWYICV